MSNITKLHIISCKLRFIRQLQASFIILEIIILTIYYGKLRNYQKKGVPQTTQISKLEWNFSKFPSQLEIGGEHLFWGTAREVLFNTVYIFPFMIAMLFTIFIFFLNCWRLSKKIQFICKTHQIKPDLLLFYTLVNTLIYGVSIRNTLQMTPALGPYKVFCMFFDVQWISVWAYVQSPINIGDGLSNVSFSSCFVAI